MSESPANDIAALADADRLVAEAVAMRRAGRVDVADARFREALGRAPDHPGALTSYAMLLLDAGDVGPALTLARRAVGVDPGRISAHHVLGRALCRAGLQAEGIAALRHAVAMRPEAFELQLELGVALKDADALHAAQAHLQRAAELAPHAVAPLVNLGNLYRLQQRTGEAIALYRHAIEVDARLPIAHNNLGLLLAEVGDDVGAIASFRRALALAPDRAGTWSNLLLALNWSDRPSAAGIASEHRAFGQYFGARIAPLEPSGMRPLDARRLHVGYVSSDFCSHAVARFMLPLLEQHDRGRFTIHAYHNLATTDEMTARIEAAVDHFSAIAHLTDDDLAQRIRADGIDILVDLNGHTANNRLPVFLRKPAPVQVTWLGYLATTGLATMDYRLTDARADPPGRTEAWHTESLWRLPATLWCYEPYAFSPDVGPLPAAQAGHVTFGSFNNPAKVSATVLALWARILAALPDAKLAMIAGSYVSRIEEMKRAFASAGIGEGRVQYLPRQSTSDFLALHNRVDIALDTWPCAGGTTTCDALWMGVPVITLAGERSFSRSGASMLANVGLEALVAKQPDDYVANAIALAQDLPRLAPLRASLREKMRASPLVDAAAFARAIESAYVAMAERAARDIIAP